MNVLPFQKNPTETGFDYESFKLQHLKEEADFAAIACLRTIQNIEKSFRTLILEDAPRIRKIKEAMKGKKNEKGDSCWEAWKKEVFPESKSKLYDIIKISVMLEKAGEKFSETALDRLLQWSLRALLELKMAGENQDAAIAHLVKFDPEEITEGVVRSQFRPISSGQKEQLLKQVDEFALEEELGLVDPKILRLRVESEANTIAKNQNKRKASVDDYQRAINLVTGKEAKSPQKNRTHPTAKQIEEMRQANRGLAEVKNNLSLENEELRRENNELNRANKDLQKALQEAFDEIEKLKTQLKQMGVKVA